MNAESGECRVSSGDPVPDVLRLLEQARRLVSSAKLVNQKELQIPSRESVAAMMRRFKKDKQYPKCDCEANRARTAADIAAEYMGLNHEQKFFFYSFTVAIAEICRSSGFREGLVYEDKKARENARLEEEAA